MTAQVPEREAALHYEAQRLGIIAKSVIEARFGESAEAKRQVAEALGMELSTLYKRFQGEPGFSAAELMLLAGLIGESVTLLYDGAGLLPSGAPLPTRAARKTGTTRAANTRSRRTPAGYAVELPSKPQNPVAA